MEGVGRSHRSPVSRLELGAVRVHELLHRLRATSRKFPCLGGERQDRLEPRVRAKSPGPDFRLQASGPRKQQVRIFLKPGVWGLEPAEDFVRAPEQALLVVCGARL
jgi:hypothetical protein